MGNALFIPTKAFELVVFIVTTAVPVTAAKAVILALTQVATSAVSMDCNAEVIVAKLPAVNLLKKGEPPTVIQLVPSIVTCYNAPVYVPVT